jgi:hypothetical protein
MAEDISLELEKNLRELNKSIAALAKVSTSDAASRRQARDLIQKEIERRKTLLKDLNQNSKEFKKVTLAVESAEDSLKSFDDATKKLAKDTLKKYSSAITDTVGQFINLGDATTTGYTRLGYFTKALEDTAFGPISGLAKSLDYNIDNFISLASVGADFGKSLVGLREGARAAQLPIEEFKDLVAENSQTLAALFGTVNQGTNNLALFSESIRSRAKTDLFELGITTDQLNEFLGTYLSRQRIQGRAALVTQQSATTSVIAYAKELNLLSRLTGIQNTELDKQVRAQQDDAVFQAYLSSLSDEQARTTQNLIATLSAVNPALGETAKNLLATGVPLDDLGQQLVALAPGFQDAILAFKQTGDVTATLQALTSSGRAFNERFRGTSGAATLLAGDLAGAANAVLKLGNLSLDLNAAYTQQSAQANELTKELVEFQDSSRRLKSSFESIQTSFLSALPTAFSNFLGGANDSFQNVANAIAKFTMENPGKVAGAVMVANAAKYGVNFAKEVSIVALGTKIGNVGLQNSMGAFGGTLTRGFGAMGRGLSVIGRGLPYAGAAIGLGTSAYQLFDEDKSNDAQGILGLVGGVAGGLLGLVGGPMGVAIGASLGSMAGQALGSMVEGRETGGSVNRGQPYLVGEGGKPELFVPGQSGEIVPLVTKNQVASKDTTVNSVTETANRAEMSRMMTQLGTNLSSMNEILVKSEKHLNSIVMISNKQLQKSNEVKNSIADLDFSV